MKPFKYIWLLAAAALGLASCETDMETPQIPDAGQFVAPAISECGNITITPENADNENIVFSWTPADFGVPVQILYSVYVVREGQEGLIGTSASTSIAISKNDLNGVVINSLGVPANEKGENIQAYVSAAIANTSQYEPIKSELSNTFYVQTYAAELRTANLCGEFMNWDIANAPEFWETTGSSNTYACMVDFSKETAGSDAANSFFKVTVGKDWGIAYGANELSASWNIVSNSDGNLSMPINEQAIHEVTVNLTAMTIAQKPIGNTIGLCGDFNEWAGDLPFKYDHLTSTWRTEPIALTAGTGVKVRVDAAWGLSWGATGKASTAISGGMELSDSGENITVPETATFVVVLHANRTPYVIEFQKQ